MWRTPGAEEGQGGERYVGCDRGGCRRTDGSAAIPSRPSHPAARCWLGPLRRGGLARSSGNYVVSITVSKWVLAFARLGSLTVSWFPCGLSIPCLLPTLPPPSALTHFWMASRLLFH
jgi:hypothetical protein